MLWWLGSGFDDQNTVGIWDWWERLVGMARSKNPNGDPHCFGVQYSHLIYCCKHSSILSIVCTQVIIQMVPINVSTSKCWQYDLPNIMDLDSSKDSYNSSSLLVMKKWSEYLQSFTCTDVLCLCGSFLGGINSPWKGIERAKLEVCARELRHGNALMYTCLCLFRFCLEDLQLQWEGRGWLSLFCIWRLKGWDNCARSVFLILASFG